MTCKCDFTQGQWGCRCGAFKAEIAAKKPKQTMTLEQERPAYQTVPAQRCAHYFLAGKVTETTKCENDCGQTWREIITACLGSYGVGCIRGDAPQNQDLDLSYKAPPGASVARRCVRCRSVLN